MVGFSSIRPVELPDEFVVFQLVKFEFCNDPARYSGGGRSRSLLVVGSRNGDATKGATKAPERSKSKLVLS